MWTRWLWDEFSGNIQRVSWNWYHSPVTAPTSKPKGCQRTQGSASLHSLQPALRRWRAWQSCQMCLPTSNPCFSRGRIDSTACLLVICISVPEALPVAVLGYRCCWHRILCEQTPAEIWILPEVISMVNKSDWLMEKYIKWAFRISPTFGVFVLKEWEGISPKLIIWVFRIFFNSQGHRAVHDLVRHGQLMLWGEIGCWASLVLFNSGDSAG